MGLFDRFKKKPANTEGPAAQMDGPYRDAANNFMYELLFCDKPELFMRDGSPDDPYPWGVICNAASTVDDLRKVGEDVSLDSRVRAISYHKLRALGGDIETGKLELLGVIVEVGTSGGLDTLAAYADGSIRYINYSGRLLVWEKKDDPTSRELVNDLMQAGSIILNTIGVGMYARRPYPRRGFARISFVIAGGFSFGEAEIGVLFEDPMAGPALKLATLLLQHITQAAEQ